MFPFSTSFSSALYTALAAGYVGEWPGLAASLGLNIKRLFIGIGVRGEIFAYQNLKGNSHSAGTLGVSWTF